MGITIHYAVSRYPMLMGNGRIPDDPFTGFIQKAEQLAQKVLNNLEFPHRIHRFDRRDDQDQSGPQLVYGFEMNSKGPGRAPRTCASDGNKPKAARRPGPAPTSARPNTPKQQTKPTELS